MGWGWDGWGEMGVAWWVGRGGWVGWGGWRGGDALRNWDRLGRVSGRVM